MPEDDRMTIDPENLSAFMRVTGLEIDEETASGSGISGKVQMTPDHHQPMGLVHGGVYASIAESACSIGASLAVMGDGKFSVGLNNSTDFIRAFREGRLDVKAWPIHQGRTGQLWQCDMTREDGKLVAQSKVRLQNVDQG